MHCHHTRTALSSFTSAVLATISRGKFSRASVETDARPSRSQDPGRFSRLKELAAPWPKLPSSDRLGRTRCSDVSEEEQTEEERVAEMDCSGVSVMSDCGETHLRNCRRPSCTTGQWAGAWSRLGEARSSPPAGLCSWAPVCWGLPPAEEGPALHLSGATLPWHSGAGLYAAPAACKCRQGWCALQAVLPWKPEGHREAVCREQSRDCCCGDRTCSRSCITVFMSLPSWETS